MVGEMKRSTHLLTIHRSVTLGLILSLIQRQNVLLEIINRAQFQLFFLLLYAENIPLSSLHI